MKRLLAVVSVFEAFALATFARNRWFSPSPQGGSVTFTVDAFGERWAAYLLVGTDAGSRPRPPPHARGPSGRRIRRFSSRRRGTPSTGFF